MFRSWPALIAEADALRDARALAMLRQYALEIRRPERMRIRTGVQLDAIGVAFGGAGNRRRIGVGEETHADAAIMQPMRHLVQKFVMREEIPSVIGGQGVGRIGHQRRLRGFHLAYEGEKIVVGITLDVEFGLVLGAQHRIEVAHILVGDVARVGTRMHRDAVASGVEAGARRLQNVGKIFAARVAQQRDLVDVDAEPNHRRHDSGNAVRPRV